MTTNTGIYQDIATRTAGDIYIGVVGPVARRQIDLHQALHGNADHPEHRQCLPPRARQG